jgi:hypothetical protein
MVCVELISIKFGSERMNDAGTSVLSKRGMVQEIQVAVKEEYVKYSSDGWKFDAIYIFKTVFSWITQFLPAHALGMCI